MDAPPTGVDERSRVVLHLGPDLREPGGMAQVVECYRRADLRPWRIEFLSIYTERSRVRQAWRILVATAALATRPRRRLQGAHIHTSHGFDLVRTVVLLQVARFRRVQTVVTIHGSDFMDDVHRTPRLVRAICKRAAAVTVLSDDVHQAAVALGGRRVLVLPNPVQARPRVTAVSARRQVLLAGEIGYRKGVDVLLRAWPRVHAAHPDVLLQLLGPVAEPALVESLSPGVRFDGPAPHAAVIEALDASSIAVLPSRSEAMPMFVLEAMAAGVPVVATAVGAVGSILAGAGVVVPVDDADALADAILDLLGDDDKLAGLGATGQRLVAENYSTEIFSQRVIALYDEVFDA